MGQGPPGVRSMRVVRNSRGGKDQGETQTKGTFFFQEKQPYFIEVPVNEGSVGIENPRQAMQVTRYLSKKGESVASRKFTIAWDVK